MSEFSDEQLSAFLDRELDPETHAAIAEALILDDELSGRLEALRAGNTAFTRSLSAIDNRPLPAGLEAMLDEADVPAQPAAANDNRPWRAVAASVALVTAFTAGSLLNPFGGTGDEAPAAIASLADDPALQTMLESDPSGTKLQLSSGQSAEIRLSFFSTDGNYCREFVLGDKSGSTVAVACRIGADDWGVQVATAGPALTDQGEGYTAASEGNSAFDAAVSALMASDSADAETEAAWIENGWQNAP